MDSFEIFRIIFFLGAVNALFFSILIFSKKQKSLADKILAWWLILLSLQVLYPFLYLSNIEKFKNYMGYEACLSVLQPAALFFYTKALVGKLKLDKRNLSLLGIIGISISSIVYFISRMPKDKAQILSDSDFLQYFDNDELFIVVVFVILFVGLYVYFLLRSNYLLKEHRKKVRGIYSNSERMELKWLKKLIIYFYISYFVMIAASVVLFLYDLSPVYNDYVFYLMMVIFVFLIGYWGHQQGQIFKIDSNVQSPNNEERNIETTQNNTNGKEYKKEADLLTNIMDEEKPFLDPVLSINDLAKLVDIPPHQLSKAIHKRFGKNFYEFVNHYRIEEFKKQVVAKEFRNFTILAVAYECGFNSKSAFNRIFKEQTNMTPREYKTQHIAVS